MDSKQLESIRLTTERIQHVTGPQRERHSYLKIQHKNIMREHRLYRRHLVNSQEGKTHTLPHHTFFSEPCSIVRLGLHLVEVPSLLTASLRTRSQLRSDLLCEDDIQHHNCRLQSQPSSNHPLYKITITL